MTALYLTPRIEEKPSFTIQGKRWQVSTRNGENFRVIPDYWDTVMSDGSFARLMTAANPAGLFEGNCLGVCFDFDDEAQAFEYMIAVEGRVGEQGKDWEQKSFPAARYAIFANQGQPLSQHVQASFKFIYETWFPQSAYVPADGPEMEVYLNDDAFEIWIPVKPRS